jgi:hypothetical protein
MNGRRKQARGKETKLRTEKENATLDTRRKGTGLIILVSVFSLLLLLLLLLLFYLISSLSLLYVVSINKIQNAEWLGQWALITLADFWFWFDSFQKGVRMHSFSFRVLSVRKGGTPDGRYSRFSIIFHYCSFFLLFSLVFFFVGKKSASWLAAAPFAHISYIMKL